MTRRTPHLSTHPGTKIKLKFRNNTSVEGKFIEKIGNCKVLLEVDGKRKQFHANNIHQFIVLKSARQHQGT